MAEALGMIECRGFTVALDGTTAAVGAPKRVHDRRRVRVREQRRVERAAAPRASQRDRCDGLRSHDRSGRRLARGGRAAREDRQRDDGGRSVRVLAVGGHVGAAPQVHVAEPCRGRSLRICGRHRRPAGRGDRDRPPGALRRQGAWVPLSSLHRRLVERRGAGAVGPQHQHALRFVRRRFGHPGCRGQRVLRRWRANGYG